jgi:hypothetical protein
MGSKRKISAEASGSVVVVVATASASHTGLFQRETMGGNGMASASQARGRFCQN